MDDERSRSSSTGAVVALQSTGKRARTGLAVGGDGTKFRLFAGGVGATLGPQRELGVTTLGIGGVVAGNHPAASAGRKAGRATGDEVSGADGADQSGRLRAHGVGLRAAALQHAASRTTLRRLAGGRARGPRAHLGRAGTVFENAATADGAQSGRGRSGARPGDGGCHPASRRPTARGSSAGDGWPAPGTSATPDRKRAPGTGADGGANRKGTASPTC